MADTYPISDKNLHSCSNNPIKVLVIFVGHLVFLVDYM